MKLPRISDALKDLQPVGEVAASPFAIVVANDVNTNTLKEFLDLARAKPRSINYGSAGVGGMNHLATELFAATSRVQLTHVPYKGISLAFTELNAVLAMQDVKDVPAREGASPRPGTPQAFGTLIKSEMVRWDRLVKEQNIQIAE